MLRQRAPVLNNFNLNVIFGTCLYSSAMSKRWKVLSAVIIGIGIYHLELVTAERVVVPLKIAWMLKPPYTLSPANGSLFEGMRRDVIFSNIHNCMTRITSSAKRYTEVKLLAQKTASEFEMIELLRQNNAQVAVPVFDSAILTFSNSMVILDPSSSFFRIG